MTALRLEDLRQHSDVLRSRHGEAVTVRFVEPRDVRAAEGLRVSRPALAAVLVVLVFVVMASALPIVVLFRRQYRRLMAHWRRLFGGRIHDADYDAFVAEPRPVELGDIIGQIIQTKGRHRHMIHAQVTPGVRVLAHADRLERVIGHTATVAWIVYCLQPFPLADVLVLSPIMASRISRW